MKILGYDYQIDLSQTFDTMRGCMGLCNVNKQIINIAKDLPEETKCSVMIHEIIEAINYHLELNLEHPQISQLETGIHQALSDNGVDLTVLLKHSKKG